MSICTSPTVASSYHFEGSLPRLDKHEVGGTSSCRILSNLIPSYDLIFVRTRPPLAGLSPYNSACMSYHSINTISMSNLSCIATPRHADGYDNHTPQITEFIEADGKDIIGLDIQNLLPSVTEAQLTSWNWRLSSLTYAMWSNCQCKPIASYHQLRDIYNLMDPFNCNFPLIG